MFYLAPQFCANKLCSNERNFTEKSLRRRLKDQATFI